MQAENILKFIYNIKIYKLYSVPLTIMGTTYIDRNLLLKFFTLRNGRSTLTKLTQRHILKCYIKRWICL